MNWNGVKTLVTGGASFIGSNLVESLAEKGAQIRVIDNLSSGRKEYLEPLLKSGQVEFLQGDLLDQETTRVAVREIEVVFHLAADHGGRGYVDLHQAACATNIALDGMLFYAAKDAGVEKIVYASSGCVYPNFIQQDPDEILYLTEDMVGPPYDADNMYGWAKLMAEMTLREYAREWGIKTASCRYFTAYGERGKEDHAVIAMIARAFIKQDPFEVWGNGEQIRNWTYVGDIVEGTIRCAENIEDGTAVNLGTMERTRVLDAVKLVMDYTGHNAEIKLMPDMPTGPMNRVADNSLAKRLLSWEPQMSFEDGLRRTVEWYYATKDRQETSENLEHALTER